MLGLQRVTLCWRRREIMFGIFSVLFYLDSFTFFYSAAQKNIENEISQYTYRSMFLELWFLGILSLCDI